MEPLLKFDDVELYYDHVYALKGVSIEVHEGETVALIGANGAGKSSILRAITGLRKIRKGEIHYHGSRIDGTAPDEIVRMGISMVPEARRVFPFMTVRDNLLMGAFTRTNKIEIQQSMDMVLTRFPRLKERYSQQAGTMSGGEQQMLVIGRALMARPRLLLLDEPCSASRRSWCKTSRVRSWRSIATKRSAFSLLSRIRAWRCAFPSAPTR
jgi:branched-chain amino acid transport system ATP-binding protein